MTSDDDEGTGAEAVPSGEFRSDRLSRLTAPPELEDDANRRRWGLGSTPEERGPYMVELQRPARRRAGRRRLSVE